MSDTYKKHAVLGKVTPLRKIIAVTVLWCFLFTTCLGEVFIEICHAGGETLFVKDVAGVISDSQAYKEFSIETFALPQNLATIKDVWSPRTRKGTVIHIQDAHCNYAAQHKIAEIIEYLQKNYGISTVNLEGGEGLYDLSDFTDINGPLVRKKVSDYFVKEGIVNGAEYYAINNPHDIKLWGVENTTLYLENLNVYKNFLKHKEEADAYLEQLDHALSNLKKEIYPDELLEFDKKYAEYKENNLDVKDYITYLCQNAVREAIDIKSFPNIYLLFRAIEEETNIDFKRANKEREILIDKLEKRLSKNSLEELVIKTVEFKEEKISCEKFYDFLVHKAGTLNISLKRFPELQKYVRYITFYNAMDKMLFMEEMEHLENKIKESLYKDDKQRELDLLSKNLVLTKNLFNITLTRRDYKYYKDYEHDFDVENYLLFSTKEAPLYKIDIKLSQHLYKLDQWRRELSAFYECSFKRDRAFLKNLKFASQKLTTNDQRLTTILITGGFHTENLAGLFKENNISYVTIMPNFKNGHDYESPYFKLLTQEQNKVLKALLCEVSTLALYADFCQNVAEVYTKDEIQARKLWIELGKALFEEKREVTVGNRLYSFQPLDGAQPVDGLKIDGRQVYARTVGSPVPVKDTPPKGIKPLSGLKDRILAKLRLGTKIFLILGLTSRLVYCGGTGPAPDGSSSYEEIMTAGSTIVPVDFAPYLLASLQSPHNATMESIMRSIEISNSDEYQELVVRAYDELRDADIGSGITYPVLFLEGLDKDGYARALTDLGIIVVGLDASQRWEGDERIAWLACKIAHERLHIENSDLPRLEQEALTYEITWQTTCYFEGKDSSQAQAQKMVSDAFAIMLDEKDRISEIFDGLDFRNIYYNDIKLVDEDGFMDGFVDIELYSLLEGLSSSQWVRVDIENRQVLTLKWISTVAHAEGMPLKNPQPVSKNGITDIGGIKRNVIPTAAHLVIDKTAIHIDNDLIEQHNAFGFENKDAFIEFLNDFFAGEISAHPPKAREITIAVLDTAEYLFEDHLANGFIGIHRSLFEKLAETPKTARDLLVIGLKHELLHEALIVEREVLAENSQDADKFISQNRNNLKEAMQKIGLWDEVEEIMLEKDIKNAKDMELDIREIIASKVMPESAPFVAGMNGKSFQSEEVNKESLQKPPPGSLRDQSEETIPKFVDPKEVVRDDGWRPLRNTVTFMREHINSSVRYEDNYYLNLADSKYFQDKAKKIFTDRKLQPAHIDTYIYNQANEIEQAFVELIANAQDAMIDGKSIGRFGVGVYQMFQELKSAEDTIIVTTSNGKVSVRLIFKMVDGVLCYKEQVLEDVLEKGTAVEVKTSLSEEEVSDRVSYAKSKLRANARGRILIENIGQINNLENYYYVNGDCLVMPDIPPVEVQIGKNGYIVKDTGRGMSPKVLFENFLVPKGSTNRIEGKPMEKISEIRDETKIFSKGVLTKEGEGTIGLQVSGVVNIDISVFGMNIPEDMIIELPHDTWLPESKDDLALDDITKEGFIAVMKKLTYPARDIKNRYALLNSLSFLVHTLIGDSEDRSLLYEFKSLCDILIRHEKSIGKIILPNREEFKALILPLGEDKESKVVYLDERLYEFQPDDLKGIERVTSFRSDTHTLYLADLDVSGENDLYLEGKYANGKGWIIFDRKTWYQRDPDLIDLLLNLDISYGDKGKKLGRIEKVKTVVSAKDTDKTFKGTQGVSYLVNEELVREISDSIFAGKTAEIFNKFSEKDQLLIKAKTEEAVRGGRITKENKAIIKQRLINWLKQLIEFKSLVSDFSPSALDENWVGNNILLPYLELFRSDKHLESKKAGKKFYFWHSNLSAFQESKVFEMDSDGKIALIAEKARAAFLEEKLYLHMWDKKTDTFQLAVREEDKNRIVLNNVVAIDSEHNDAELVVLTGENGKITVHIVQKDGIEVFCRLTEETVMADFNTLCMFKRENKVFIGQKYFAESIYQIDRSGHAINLNFPLMLYRLERLIEVAVLPNGNSAVYGTFREIRIPGIASRPDPDAPLMFIFDKQGTCMEIGKRIPWSGGIQPQPDTLKIYDDWLYYVEEGLLKRWREGRNVEIFVANRGFLTDIDETEAAASNIIFLGSIEEIAFSGSSVYIVNAARQLMKCSLENGKHMKIAIVKSEAIEYGYNLYYMAKSQSIPIGLTGKVETSMTSEIVLIMFDKEGNFHRTDFENNIVDILGGEDSFFVLEEKPVKREGTGYSEFIITKFSHDGKERKNIYKIEAYSAGSSNFSKTVNHQIEEFIFIREGAAGQETIMYDAKTEKETKIVGYNLIQNAFPMSYNRCDPNKVLKDKGNLVIDHRPLPGTVINVLSTIPLITEKTWIFERNISEFKKHLTQIKNFIAEFNKDEVMNLITSLQTSKTWIPALIFLDRDYRETDKIYGIKHVFDEIITKAKSTKELRQIFSFINYVLNNMSDKELAIRVIERWSRIFFKNKELADVIASSMKEKFSIKKRGMTLSKSPLRVYCQYPDRLSDLPHGVRFFLDFLVKDKMETPEIIDKALFQEGKGESLYLTGDFSLAGLIRLQQLFPKEIASPDVTWEKVCERIKEVHPQELKGLRDEITGAVNGQDKVGLYWIRELVQNARDVIRGMFGIEVKSGFIGHGFYTVFAGRCNEVRLRTGNGRETYELILLPEYDPKEDLIDVKIKSIRRYFSDYKGTRIERAKFFTNQADEDAMIGIMWARVQAKRFLGAVPSKGEDGVTILLNDGVVNEDGYRWDDPNRIVRITNGMSNIPNEQGYYEWIAGVEDPAGMDLFTVLNNLFPVDISGKAPQGLQDPAVIGRKIKAGFSKERICRVNVDSLYVDEVSAKYTKSVPKTALDILLKKGWNIEFPAGTPVSRTRKGVKNPKQYEPWIAASALKELVKLYLVDKKVKIPLLPQDYVYSRTNAIRVCKDVFNDAKNINKGNAEKVDFEKYKKDPFALTQLIVVIEVDLKGKKFSLNKIKKRVLEEYKKKEASLIDLKGVLPRGMRDQEDMAESQIKGEIESRKIDIKDILDEPVISAFKDFFNILKDLTDTNDNYAVFNCVDKANYCAKGGGDRILWNIAYYSDILTPFIDFVLNGEKGIKFREFIQMYTHETAHTVEDTMISKYRRGWSHQSEQDVEEAFGWIMKKVLMRMIKKVDSLEALRQEFLKKTKYTPEELKLSYDKVIKEIEKRKQDLLEKKSSLKEDSGSTGIIEDFTKEEGTRGSDIQSRIAVTLKAFNSEPLTKTRDPIALVGLPEEIKNKGINIEDLKRAISRGLGKSGHGSPRDPHKVDFFFIVQNDSEATKTNIKTVLDKCKTHHPGQELVLFIPEMAEAGLKVKSDREYVNSLEHEFGDVLTIVPDAYTDLDFSLERKFVDIDARIAIARLIGWYKEAEGYEEACRLQAQAEAMRALTDYLAKITGEDMPDDIKDLNELLKGLLLRIKPVNYNDIAEWEKTQKAIVTSL